MRGTVAASHRVYYHNLIWMNLLGTAFDCSQVVWMFCRLTIGNQGYASTYRVSFKRLCFVWCLACQVADLQFVQKHRVCWQVKFINIFCLHCKSLPSESPLSFFFSVPLHEEPLAQLVAGDHDGARRGNLEHARHQAGVETRNAWMERRGRCRFKILSDKITYTEYIC